VTNNIIHKNIEAAICCGRARQRRINPSNRPLCTKLGWQSTMGVGRCSRVPCLRGFWKLVFF